MIFLSLYTHAHYLSEFQEKRKQTKRKRESSGMYIYTHKWMVRNETGNWFYTLDMEEKKRESVWVWVWVCVCAY
jgi:hypothetical protein